MLCDVVTGIRCWYDSAALLQNSVCVWTTPLWGGWLQNEMEVRRGRVSVHGRDLLENPRTHITWMIT